MHHGPRHKRSSGRIPVALPVHWRRPEGDISTLLTENVSEGGMLLRSAHFVPPDRRISLAIQLPGQYPALQVSAQVRFVGPAADGFSVGVQIVEMAGEALASWRAWCERILGGAAEQQSADCPEDARRSHANILLVAAPLPTSLLESLAANGYHVNSVRGAIETLTLLRQRRDFELVICEVRRHDLDGRALCNLIKQDPALREVPVLLLAEQGSAQDLLDGLDAGAAYVVSKPFTEEFLLSLIALCQRG